MYRFNLCLTWFVLGTSCSSLTADPGSPGTRQRDAGAARDAGTSDAGTSDAGTSDAGLVGDASVGAADAGNSDPRCRNHADCAADEVCRQPSCDSDTDCRDGEVCSLEGSCVSASCNERVCEGQCAPVFGRQREWAITIAGANVPECANYYEGERDFGGGSRWTRYCYDGPREYAGPRADSPPDTYVIVTIDGQTCITDIAVDSPRPAWEKTCSFTIFEDSTWSIWMADADGGEINTSGPIEHGDRTIPNEDWPIYFLEETALPFELLRGLTDQPLSPENPAHAIVERDAREDQCRQSHLSYRLDWQTDQLWVDCGAPEPHDGEITNTQPLLRLNFYPKN